MLLTDVLIPTPATPLSMGFGTHHPASMLAMKGPPCPQTPDIKIPNVQKPLVTFVFHLELLGLSLLYLLDVVIWIMVTPGGDQTISSVSFS